MDIRALNRILERVEAGTTTPTDAEALRAVFRLYLAPAHERANEAPHHDSKYTRRVDSRAVVEVGVTRDRFPRGEYHVRAVYAHVDGASSSDRSRRVYIRGPLTVVVVELWEALFDVTATALQNDPATLTLHIDDTGLEPPWTDALHTVAAIVAHELNTRVEIVDS